MGSNPTRWPANRPGGSCTSANGSARFWGCATGSVPEPTPRRRRRGGWACRWGRCGAPSTPRWGGCVSCWAVTRHDRHPALSRSTGAGSSVTLGRPAATGSRPAHETAAQRPLAGTRPAAGPGPDPPASQRMRAVRRAVRPACLSPRRGTGLNPHLLCSPGPGLPQASRIPHGVIDQRCPTAPVLPAGSWQPRRVEWGACIPSPARPRLRFRHHRTHLLGRCPLPAAAALHRRDGRTSEASPMGRSFQERWAPRPYALSGWSHTG